MAPDLIEALVPLAGVLLTIACARTWLARTADLNLSLFRPYRGDPWPRGVQEDDDFRFNWTPATASASATVVGAAVGNLIGGVEHESVVDLTEAGRVEDVHGGSVASERVDRIRVRRIGR